MDNGVVLLVLGIVATIVWAMFTVQRFSQNQRLDKLLSSQKIIDDAIGRVFSDDFREELKNKGRLQFEKILRDNAAFLQTDLRVTTSDINNYVKSEITKILNAELQNYKQTVDDAKIMATDGIKKAEAEIENSKELVKSEVRKAYELSVNSKLQSFGNDFNQIIGSSIKEALNDQIDVSAQMPLILKSLEIKKSQIEAELQGLSRIEL